jgi:TIR domain-containing protein
MIKCSLTVTMTSTAEAGISPTSGTQVLGVSAAQLGLPNLVSEPVVAPPQRDRVYGSNEDLWNDLIGRVLLAPSVIRLEAFWLSEWFPLRPGLFHTRGARDNRRMAKRYLLTGPGVTSDGLAQFERIFGRRVSPELIGRLRPDSTYVYDPYGKSLLLDGGVGCIRLKPKQAPAGPVWFMGASSTPVAHEGIPVALPDNLYSEFIEQVVFRGSLRCTMTGRIMFIPPDFDPLYRDLVGIPQVYLLVDALESPRIETDVRFVANGAVMIEAQSTGHRPHGSWDLTDGIYAAFVSFNPSGPAAIQDAAEWLAETYVGELLAGRVITDFDEQVRHFSGTTFSLDQVMRGRVSVEAAERALSRCAPSPQIEQLFIERIKTVNIDARNMNVVGEKKLFISYSHRDERYREQLVTHLAGLRRQGIIADWHDRKIAGGEEWRDAIDRNLDEADCVLLLISADFLASDYCYGIEMQRTLEKYQEGRVIVIPVIVRPADWQYTPLGELQALPKDAKPVVEWASRDRAWLNVTEGIRRALVPAGE